MSRRYVCIHGHFYQPPRENPWLEAIEVQDSAEPYHDWNQRITFECYAPNSRSRILDGDGRITRIVNNYSRISFNFGPTLLSWIEQHDPDTYAAIRDADQRSQERFGGHGSALAQVYNHAIMPLCNRRDKVTQVRWGKADFVRRFGRPPEGMWLAETAVDIETLEVLAAEGLRFTILSPYQAKRVRPLDGNGEWQDVLGGRIDPTRTYQCRLPSGAAIALFFYDGPVSQAVAFENLLQSGEKFASRLLGTFSDARTWPQIVHIATDGETYGHHSRYGDMALAYALDLIEKHPDVRLTNYGEFLANHPPTQEVEIVENSAWSCAHGVGRWKEDCGCRAANRAGWTQEWRGPLRAALDWLRDEVTPLYEKAAGKLFKDPWAVRDAYVDVILNRSPENVVSFLARHVREPLDDAKTVTALKLLELQRNCLLMYTSCGWFFDELSGIETVQVIQYAGRAVQLAEELFGNPVEPSFLDRLARAKSNVRGLRDGRRIYDKLVRPARVDLPKVAAHYAVSALFHDDPGQTQLFCYTAGVDDLSTAALGKARFISGNVRVTSTITRESAAFAFAAADFGEMHLHGGVRPLDDPAAIGLLRAHAEEAFQRFDIPAFVRLVDRAFDAGAYSLRSLFRDEQRAIIARITDTTTQALETVFRQVYDAHAPTMHFLRGLDRPVLPAFRKVADFLLNLDLWRACADDAPDLQLVRKLLQEAQDYDVSLDVPGLAFVLSRTTAKVLDQLAADPDDAGLLRLSDGLLDVIADLSFPVDLWRAQNTFYALRETAFRERCDRAAAGCAADGEWCTAFAALGAKLGVSVPEIADKVTA
jgi:alpha-amylase/alpha-mannosidase (GH57 family)